MSAPHEPVDPVLPDVPDAAEDEPRLPLEPALPVVATIAAAAALYWALRPTPLEPHSPLVPVGAVYAVLGALAVYRAWLRGDLSLVRPRSGDITFGAMVAALLYGMGFAGHVLLTAPGSGRSGWMLQVYQHLGTSFGPSRHLFAAGIALVALLEELSWRGLVTPILEERLGTLRGNALNVALYGAAHLPSLWLLADATAGPNPLLLVASVGCGVVWSYLRWRLDRLPPALFSHALFTWAIVEFPFWRA